MVGPPRSRVYAIACDWPRLRVLASCGADMAPRPPLRLFWWNKTANFGDGISPLVVAHASGRRVVWAAPEDAEIFAVGSILRAAARAFKEPRTQRPVIWGSGCMKPVGRAFTAHVDFAAVRGPRTAEVLKLDPLPFGDPGLLIRDAMGEDIVRTERIAVVPHHAHRSLHAFDMGLSDRGDVDVVDVTAPDPLEVVRSIARCRHVFSSSLHGLVVADAFGVPSTWVDPKGIHAEPEFKFRDYAEAIGRELGQPVAPEDIAGLIPDLPDTPNNDRLDVAGITHNLKQSFPAALAA